MSRLALVTGGTRGIGAAIARELKAAGNKVVVLYAKDPEAAQRFREETRINVIKCDVSSYEECASAVQEVEKSFGKNVEILVNNAGITMDGMLHKSVPADWNTLINNNLTSCYNMCRVVINQMREAGWGRIINLSSINALSGQLGQTNYSAAKAGIIGFTKSLALESARKNITVNAIAPGYTDTPMVAQMDKAVLDQIIAKIPMTRLCTPQEVAKLAAFLASETAGYITGETVSINGGLYMR